MQPLTGEIDGHRRRWVNTCRLGRIYHELVGAYDAGAARHASDIDTSRSDRLSRCGSDNKSYSVLSASAGEIRLARSAGIKDATSAENPRVRTATKITSPLYGFSP